VSLSDSAGKPGSKKRRLIDEGVTFAVHEGRGITEGALENLLALHAERAAAAGWATTFTDARREFHGALAKRSNEVHRSVLVSAQLGEHVVGGLYGFADSRAFYYYQSGWSPGFERLSLGSVLLAEAIDLASGLGLDEFDFLRGNEPYKHRFGAVEVDDVSYTRLRGLGGAVLSTRDAAASLIRDRRLGQAERP
jgi:CelD/BcsL family acetyltransferase involved in cellulose biosynthesis